ncbi:hydroxyisourate hydrolase [Paracoccus sp. S1E-3]|uniref:hydroxyisourate hydrolase n=1 Tax=Paracoccus sp. S1E-3 TaxID=2756130 RepID=UPI0015EEB313|nr:hydroxyisourate hydrolase [Paracoccus sp. S1E-3]MBA4490670.1 hydroxyisourate hydrolase [Paracoccus sp. S1E-3]
MAGYLTTHVLDTGAGRPAAGLKIDLYRIDGEGGGEARSHLKSVITNTDGRTDAQILPAEEFSLGTYELVFHAGDYLGKRDFLDLIPLRFTMSEASHYHVPLLLSPYSYSTYRGS